MRMIEIAVWLIFIGGMLVLGVALFWPKKKVEDDDQVD